MRNQTNKDPYKALCPPYQHAQARTLSSLAPFHAARPKWRGTPMTVVLGATIQARTRRAVSAPRIAVKKCGKSGQPHSGFLRSTATPRAFHVYSLQNRAATAYVAVVTLTSLI